MFCPVFVFSAAFTAFIVLTVCLSVTYFVYDFIINKYRVKVRQSRVRVLASRGFGIGKKGKGRTGEVASLRQHHNNYD